MNNRAIELLEILEDKIENIKWLITTPLSFKKAISPTISLIRRSAGILGKNSPKGTAFENKVRREWKANVLKRIG